MKRLSSIILLLCLLLTSAAIASPQVVLITIGPGDASWEKFGHNMLWIDDADRGVNYCYNWGLFDFDQPGFIPNFIRGRMTYSMDAFEPHSAMGIYWEQKRAVTMQRLDLTPAEIDKMIDLCEANRLPQNQNYKYDYFKDNCSTRVRDMIDRSTNGHFARECLSTARPSGMSYRDNTMRLMQDDLWLSLGLDFTFGPSCDIPLTAQEECFLPTRLAGFAKAMTQSQWEPWPTDRPAEPQTIPNRAPRMAAIGIGISGIMIAAARRRDWAGRWLVGLWWVVSGAGGALLVFMWAFTDHVAAHANQNILHFSPLAWVALALLIFRKRAWAWKTSIAIAAISMISMLLKLPGVLSQHNGALIALALPLNLAAVAIIRPRGLTLSALPSEVSAT